jgi:hypothetical protein
MGNGVFVFIRWGPIMQRRLKQKAVILPFTAIRPKKGMRSLSLTMTLQRPSCKTRVCYGFDGGAYGIVLAANAATIPDPAFRVT